MSKSRKPRDATAPADITESQRILAERIRERMAVLGLNPYSAARKAELGADFVRDILRGRVQNPSAERLGKLARALDSSLYYLLGHDEIRPYDARTGEPEPEPPAPLPPAPDHAGKQPLLLPIRFELMADTFRRAQDVVRPPIGYEAATIPAAYQGRASWWELQRDDSMARVAPPGSLVQVVEMADSERNLIVDGDIVVITKRMSGPHAEYNYMERSLRRVHYRMPELGLWFLEYAHADPDMDITDDIFRETAPTAPRKPLSWYFEQMDPEDQEAVRESTEKLTEFVRQAEERRAADPEEMDRFMKRMEDPESLQRVLAAASESRAKLVGKAIRVLMPTDPRAGFGTQA